MRRAIRALACAVSLVAALCAPAVAVAANGQLAAVVDGRLVALNPDGSGLRTLPVADAQQITELAWSPDGNRLAFVHGRARSGCSSFRLGGSLTVTTGGGDANPGWSADGTRIGFRRGLFVMRVGAAGGTPEQHGRGLPPGTTEIAWAPDLKAYVPVVGNLLALAGLDTPPPVRRRAGVGARTAARSRSRDADGLSTIPAALGPVTPVARGRPARRAGRRTRARCVYSDGRRAAHRRRCGRRAADGADGRAGGRRRLAAVHGRRHGELRIRRAAAAAARRPRRPRRPISRSTCRRRRAPTRRAAR